MEKRMREIVGHMGWIDARRGSDVWCGVYVGCGPDPANQRVIFVVSDRRGADVEMSMAPEETLRLAVAVDECLAAGKRATLEIRNGPDFPGGFVGVDRMDVRVVLRIHVGESYDNDSLETTLESSAARTVVGLLRLASSSGRGGDNARTS